MEWFKLSSKLPRDPKWKILSPRAKATYIEMACEVAEQETDGLYVNAAKVPSPAEMELKNAGLIESQGAHWFLPAFTKWNFTRDQMDAKRNAGRNAAGIRWGNGKRNAEPNTEVEVEVERELELEDQSLKAPAAHDVNPQQPTHDQLYLAEQLGDLTPAAIVKLNQKHGRVKVEDAMRLMRGFPPEEKIRSNYAYLDSMAGGFDD